MLGFVGSRVGKMNLAGEERGIGIGTLLHLRPFFSDCILPTAVIRCRLLADCRLRHIHVLSLASDTHTYYVRTKKKKKNYNNNNKTNRHSEGQPPGAQESRESSVRLQPNPRGNNRHLRRRLLPEAGVPARDDALLRPGGRGHPADAPVLSLPGRADVGGARGGGDAGTLLPDGAGKSECRDRSVFMFMCKRFLYCGPE